MRKYSDVEFVRKIKKILLILTLSIIIFSAFVFGSQVPRSDDEYLINNSGDMHVVILTASSGAMGFGHTALLFEHNDSWFYFSWQSTKVVFSEVPKYALDDFDSFNSWILEDDTIQNYHAFFDSAILIQGDFNSSFYEAEQLYLNYLNVQDLAAASSNNSLDDSLVSLLDKNYEYNVFFNNCVHVSNDILSHGFINNESFNDVMIQPNFISNIANRQFMIFLDFVPFFD